jgi:hypothetical protein
MSVPGGRPEVIGQRLKDAVAQTANRLNAYRFNPGRHAGIRFSTILMGLWSWMRDVFATMQIYK